MANDNRMKFEAEFDFDTKVAAQKAQVLLQTLNKFKDVEAQGNAEVKKLQRGLKGVADEATKAWGDRGLGKVGTNLVNIDKWNKKLETTRGLIAAAKEELANAKAKRERHLKAGDSNILDVAKIKAARDEVEKYEQQEKELLGKIKRAEQENIGLNKAAAHFVKEYDKAFNTAIDIRSIINATKQEAAELTAEEKKGVDTQKDATEAAKDTADATEKIIDAQKKLNEETGKTTEKQKENTSTAKGSDATENVATGGKTTTDRENKILALVKSIHELRSAGDEASNEIAELMSILRGFDTAAADAATLRRFLDDTAEAVTYLRKELNMPTNLADIFNMVTAAEAPAKVALNAINNEAKTTGNNVAQAAAEAAAQQRQMAAETAAQQRNIIKAYLIAHAEEERRFAEHQELQDQIDAQQRKDISKKQAYILAMLALDEQYQAEQEAKQAADVQSKQDYLTALNAIFTQQEAEYRELLQAVSDTITEITSNPAQSKNIAALTRQLQDLQNAKKALESVGIPESEEEHYATILRLITQTKDQINAYTKANEKAKSSGVSFSTVVSNALKILKSVMGSILGPLSKVSNGFKSLANSTKKGFSAIPKLTDNIKSSFNSMAKSMRSNFKHLLTGITKYVFGFRSLFFLVRRLRKYLGEGIKNLAQFEGGNNAVNESITDMLSSLLYLKNAWAAAFSPIIQFVRPVLVSLIDNLAAVGNAIARMLSFLFNQEIAFNAVRVDAQDYADSLDGVGDSAGGAADKTKKLTDRLAAFDDLNVLGKDNDDTTGSGGGGGSSDTSALDPNEMFKIVDTEGGLIQKLQEMWAKADFSELGNTLRDKIISALEGIEWGKVREVVLRLGISIVTFLNGVFADDSLWKSVGDTIHEGLRTALMLAYAMVTNNEVNWGARFAVLINSIFSFDEFDDVTFIDVVESFGTQLVDSINGFFDTLEPDNIEEAFITIGTAIGTFIDKLAGDATLFVNVGTAFADGTNSITSGIAALLNEISDTDFGGNLAASINAYFSNVDLSVAFGNIVLAINTLKDNIISFLKNLNWKGEMDSTGTLHGGLLEAFSEFGSMVGEVIMTTLGDEELMTWVANGIGNLINGITLSFQSTLDTMNGEDIGSAIYKFFETLLDTINWEDLAGVISDGLILALQALTRLSDALAEDDSLQEAIYSFISGLDLTNLFSALGENISSSIETSTAIATAILEVFNKAMEDENIRQGISDAISNLIGNLDMVEISKAVTEFTGELLGTVLINLPSLLWTFAQGVIDGMSTALANGLQGIAESSDVENWWEEPGWAIVEGLAKGITEALGLEIVSEWFAGIIEDFCDFFGIHSPSTVFEGYGENIVEGLKQGIENLIDTVMEPFNKLKDDLVTKWEEVKTDAKEKWELVKSTVTEKAEEIKESATEKFDTLKTNLVDKWQEIKGNIYEKLIGIKSNAIEVFEQLKEKVKDPINGFIDIIERMVNKVIDGINWLAEEFNSLPDVQFSWMGQNYELGFNIPTIGHIDIPPLANGAVIPPNKEFMAILGDQSHGTNIEAPLDTIKQAVAEVVGNNRDDEVIDLLQELIKVVESKNLTIGDKEIGKANARFTNQQRIIRGTTF